jgi:DNA-binding transcriptional LysR family regulator
VSLSQIQYFVAVAEEGHVGRAARGLRIAQPAVSRQIRRLEDELGTTLFVRTPRGMELSSPGALFLKHARAILGAVSAAERDVRRLGSSGTG